MSYVFDPGPHGRTQLVGADQTRCMRNAKISVVPTKLNDFPPFQPPFPGVHNEAQERDAFRNGLRLCTVVHSQSQTRQTSPNLTLPMPQILLLVGEQDEVVDIADVRLAAQLPTDELVEWVHVDVSPELAGQIADRQPPRTPRRGKVVTGEPGHIVDFA